MKKPGQAAEEAVARYLRERGYRIAARNYRIGRVGELDIVAVKDGVYCFVEVRSRSSDRYGLPAESVGAKKQKKLRLLAELFLTRHELEVPARFDVASVLMKGDQLSIEYFEDAFE